MKTITRYLSVAALAVVVASVLPVDAHAAYHGRGGHGGGRPDRDWHGHEYRARGYWGHPDPGVVYAPPVVYSPPPEYEQSSGINLILPLHIH